MCGTHGRAAEEVHMNATTSRGLFGFVASSVVAGLIAGAVGMAGVAQREHRTGDPAQVRKGSLARVCAAEIAN